MPEQFALLWSKKSNGFHVEPVSRTVESGMRFFLNNQGSDYLVIAAGSAEEVANKADELRPVLFEREGVKRLYGTDSE